MSKHWKEVIEISHKLLSQVYVINVKHASRPSINKKIKELVLKVKTSSNKAIRQKKETYKAPSGDSE